MGAGMSDYCSDKTLADRLDCSVTTVRDYAARGVIPKPHRIGGLVRWRWSDVDSAISGDVVAPEVDEVTEAFS